MLAEPLATVTFRHVTPADLPAISALSEVVFGPGRFVRTAYRVREGTPAISRFCRLAEAGGRLVAAIRMTEIQIGASAGALLLGPLAVAPELAGKGYGRQLIDESVAEAVAAGRRLVLLVGDLAYYGRFGFRVVPPGQILLPGPVDPARLLALELTPGALSTYTGMVSAPPRTR